MTLIKCTECGQEISDTAITCPKCGRPMQKSISDEIKEMEEIIKGSKSMGWVDIIVCVMFLITIVASLVIYAYASGRIDTMIADSQSMIATAQSGEAKQSASNLLELMAGLVTVFKIMYWSASGMLGLFSVICLLNGINWLSSAKKINSIVERLKTFNNKR